MKIRQILCVLLFSAFVNAEVTYENYRNYRDDLLRHPRQIFHGTTPEQHAQDFVERLRDARFQSTVLEEKNKDKMMDAYDHIIADYLNKCANEERLAFLRKIMGISFEGVDIPMRPEIIEEHCNVRALGFLYGKGREGTNDSSDMRNVRDDMIVKMFRFSHLWAVKYELLARLSKVFPSILEAQLKLLREMPFQRQDITRLRFAPQGLIPMNTRVVLTGDEEQGMITIFLNVGMSSKDDNLYKHFFNSPVVYKRLLKHKEKLANYLVEVFALGRNGHDMLRACVSGMLEFRKEQREGFRSIFRYATKNKDFPEYRCVRDHVDEILRERKNKSLGPQSMRDIHQWAQLYKEHQDIMNAFFPSTKAYDHNYYWQDEYDDELRYSDSPAYDFDYNVGD